MGTFSYAMCTLTIDFAYSILSKNPWQGNPGYRESYRWIRPDNNEVRWLHCRASLVERHGELLFEGCIIDLSDEQRYGTSDPASADALPNIIETLPFSYISLDRDLRILRLSKDQQLKKFHFGDPGFLAHQLMVGRAFLECFSVEHRKRHYESLLTQVLSGRLTKHEERHSSPERTLELAILPIQAKSHTIGAALLIRDISKVAKLEDRLGRLEKGEALKTLAIGLAHNINNALQAIMGHSLAIRENPSNETINAQASQRIFELSKQASSLTEQLFELEANSSSVRNPVDLNLISMSAVNKMEDMFSSGLKIAVAFGNPPVVLAEKAPLERVIEHILRTICKHSQEAKNISITTYQVNLRKDEVGDLTAGTYAKLCISEGVNSTNSEAITIRAVQEDSDTYKRFRRALDVTYELGGRLMLEEYSQGGLIISMYFRVPDMAFSSPPHPEVVRVTESPPNVLIIDDDMMVLDTVQRLLINSGYNCLAAEDSHKALSLAREHSKTLKVVLLDALMPGMNGARLLKKLREIRADFKVIGFSGAPPEITRSLLEEGAVRILRKPVDPVILKNTVAELLAAAESAQTARAGNR